MAVAFGARIFEKHFTIDHNLPGPDHWFSADPQELKKWVSSIRIAYTMLGTSEVKPTKNEEKIKVLARRSIIALDDIEKDEVFTDKNIGAKRPGNGLPPTMIESIVGLKARQKIPKDKLISQNDFGEKNENI